MARKKRRWLVILICLVVAFGGLLVVGTWAASEAEPVGISGPKAEQMRRKMMEAVDAKAWDTTGIITWNFRDKNRHLWDRDRGLVQVEWDAYRVLMNVQTQKGIAYQANQELAGKKADEVLQQAWASWINDAFWLNPILTFQNPGVMLAVAEDAAGREGLLVSYSQGGVTPGDKYLWFADDQGLPTEWKLWVSTLPIGGIGFSWEGWQTLSTGAKVATIHDAGIATVQLKDIKASRQWTDWYSADTDPFQSLHKRGL